MHAVGIDIGGTKIAGALVDESGVIVKELRIPSPIDDSNQMIEAIGSVIDQLTGHSQVIGVGVAAAGFLSADREIMYHAPNIAAWRNEPLKSRIESKTSYPVLLENDANAAGWAEFRFGAGRDVQSMIMHHRNWSWRGNYFRRQIAQGRLWYRRRTRPRSISSGRTSLWLRAAGMS